MEHKGVWWNMKPDGGIVYHDEGSGQWVDWDPDVTRLQPPPALLLDFSPGNKMRVVRLLASAGGKYSKPFTQGQVAAFSLIGTESWTDYAQVVLQMMLVDSLARLEMRLDDLGVIRGQPSDES